MEASPLKKPVRVRFAPSPTGPLHLGGARTALFNWLFARQNQGRFILRIEDTDRERSEKRYEIELMDGLSWLGLNWDEGPTNDPKKYRGNYGPYRQSERTELYKKYLSRLLQEGKAYYCYCSKEELEAERQAMLAQGLPPKYSGHCRDQGIPPPGKKPQVIRFKTVEAIIEFKDLIRGKVSFNASLFGDLVIAKDIENPLYNFAAVVDDSAMEISHVVRGEEHLSNTPKQILLQKALGFEEPVYAHLPLILGTDRSKLSKRFADVALAEYRRKGFLPEAMVNFLSLLGWHPKDEREILTLDELVGEFDLKRVQKGGAIFNQEKLEWLQKERLKGLTTEEMVNTLVPLLKEKKIVSEKKFLKKVVEVERGRIKTLTLDEFLNLAGFFFNLPDYKADLLVWQKEPISKIKNILSEILSKFNAVIVKSLGREEILNLLSDIIAREGRGTVLWPLRVALSGLAASPDPLEIVDILGIDESKRRIELAIDKIKKLAK